MGGNAYGRDVKPPLGHALVLTGPTASGKTDVAHILAREMGVDILSADSMAVYRGMDIGTAKPTPEQRREVRYWGVDLVEPEETFSLAHYRLEVLRAIGAAAERGEGLIVAGGTGLYLKALIAGLDCTPGPDPALRAHWAERTEKEGLAPLWEEIRLRASRAWALMNESDRHNPRRLIRALERARGGENGGAASGYWKRCREREPVLVALWPDDETARWRIARRVRWMYENGLIEEARVLRERVGGKGCTALQAIGYAEAIAVLEGRLNLAEAQAVTYRRTWKFFRRQRTWFRHQANLRPILIQKDETVETLAGRVLEVWRALGPIRLQAPVSAERARPE